MCCAGDKALRNFCPHTPPAACPLPPPPPPPPPADTTLAASSDSTADTAATGMTGSGKAERSAMRAVINAGGGVEGANSVPVSRDLSITVATTATAVPTMSTIGRVQKGHTWKGSSSRGEFTMSCYFFIFCDDNSVKWSLRYFCYQS